MHDKDVMQKKHRQISTESCRRLLLHGSLILLLTLVGCTGLTPPSQTVVPSPTILSVSPTDIPPTPTRQPKPMVNVIRLWLPEELDPYGTAPGANILEQHLADLSKTFPDLQIEVTVKPVYGRGGIIDFMRTAREAAPSVMPDLVIVPPSDLETLASSGLIYPLDGLLSSAELDDRFPFAAELGAPNGETLGFVLGADMQHLVYRPTELDSPPVSWPQVITPPVSFLFPAGGGQQIDDATLIQYVAAGGSLDDLEGTPQLNEAALIKVLDFYSACVSTGAISPTVVLAIADADQAWERFKAGEGDIAVVKASTYWLDPAAGETYAAAPVPTVDGRPLSIVRGSWAIALAAEDPERQVLAMTLLNWLISPDRNAQWTQAAGYLPARRSTLRMWELSGSDRVALLGILEAAILPPPSETAPTAGPAMQEAMESVLKGRATPKEAVETAVRRLKE